MRLLPNNGAPVVAHGTTSRCVLGNLVIRISPVSSRVPHGETVRVRLYPAR